MSFNILTTILGIIGLGAGAELIVRGSMNLANLYRVSGYIIGFTIVAFGTSIPELSATITAISYPEINSVGLALGNIIGSNIANILLILGIISIFRDIKFGNKEKQKNETLWVLIITFVVIGIFIILAETQSSSPLTIFVGILLICGLLLYLTYQFLIEKNKDEFVEQIQIKYSQLTSYIFIIFGVFLIVAGSYYFILGSKNIAITLGVSEAVIGFTLVAFGTSLPELATGIAAAIKNQTKLVVGTILGSNVYNIVGIFAVILLVKGNDFPNSIDVYFESLVFMAAVTIIFTIKIRRGFKIFGYHFQPFRIGRKTGIIFLISYILYISYSYIS